MPNRAERRKIASQTKTPMEKGYQDKPKVTHKVVYVPYNKYSQGGVKHTHYSKQLKSI